MSEVPPVVLQGELQKPRQGRDSGAANEHASGFRARNLRMSCKRAGFGFGEVPRGE